MTDDHGRLRISNDDRDKAIEQLRAALDEGRIDLAEFDDRTRSAYEAKTNAELDLIFEDLPGGRPKEAEVVPVDQPVPGPRAQGPHGDPHARRGHGPLHELPALRGLISVGLITVAIWFATWIGSGDGNPPYFWPIWPILGLGIATVLQLVNRGSGDDCDDDPDDRRERRDSRRDDRH